MWKCRKIGYELVLVIFNDITENEHVNERHLFVKGDNLIYNAL